MQLIAKWLGIDKKHFVNIEEKVGLWEAENIEDTSVIPKVPIPVPIPKKRNIVIPPGKRTFQLTRTF